MHLGGIAELLRNGRGRCRLDKLSKTRAGIRKAPGRKLDAQPVKSLPGFLDELMVHYRRLASPLALSLPHLYSMKPEKGTEASACACAATRAAATALRPFPSPRAAICTAKFPMVEASLDPQCTSRPVRSAVKRFRNSLRAPPPTMKSRFNRLPVVSATAWRTSA